MPFSRRPVMTSFPFPGTTATSHASSSPPPFDVTESPLVSPISSCSSFLPRRYFGTLVIQIEIMVVERAVLLRVEHLEQRRRGIAPEVGRHLVDLVQEEHRIVGPDLLQRLNELPRHRADVRAPMPANLRFVAHAA